MRAGAARPVRSDELAAHRRRAKRRATPHAHLCVPGKRARQAVGEGGGLGVEAWRTAPGSPSARSAPIGLVTVFLVRGTYLSDRVRPYDGVGPLASLEVDDTRPGRERGRGGVLPTRGPSGLSEVSSHSLQTAKHGAWFCASIIHRSHLLGGPTLVASRCFSLWRCDRNKHAPSCARVRGLRQAVG